MDKQSILELVVSVLKAYLGQGFHCVYSAGEKISIEAGDGKRHDIYYLELRKLNDIERAKWLSGELLIGQLATQPSIKALRRLAQYLYFTFCFKLGLLPVNRIL